MGLLQDIVHAITGGHPTAPQQSTPLAQRPASQGGPDLTYNPNPATNIPFSSHNPQYVLNMHQQFQPQQVRGMQQQHGQASNYSTPIQGHQNPGLIPMQGSHGVAGIQGSYPQIQAGNYNPQQNINF